MHVKSITIQGMHKVDKVRYDFDDHLTYFYGMNGAGKSTILQAVQLAILGYIPGLLKTSESIFSHSNGNVMSVTAELDDDGTSISITRTWIKKGSGVQCSVNIEPATIDDKYIQSCLGDIELPVFNFAEFNSLSANKMKDWFMNFLPAADATINWKEEFLNAAEESGIIVDDSLNEFIDSLASDTSDSEGIVQIRDMNAILKEKQSYVKGQIQSTQSTVSSLIHYEDIDAVVDTEELRNDIKDLQNKKILAAQEQTARNAAVSEMNRLDQSISQSEAELESIKSNKMSLHYDKDLYEDASNSLAKVEEELNHLRAQIATELNSIKDLENSASNSVCPVLNCECEKLTQAVQDRDNKIHEHDATLKELEAEKQSLIDEQTKYQYDVSEQLRSATLIDQYDFKIKTLESNIESMKSRKASLVIPEVNVVDMASLDAKIAEKSELLVKCEANKKYDALIDKVTADKFKYETQQELLKVLVKWTDVNGMQTRFMNASFEAFEAKLSPFISKMFGPNVSAKFNLESRANSFSFGIMRDSTYVKYDLLSSGEKCLYLSTFMMCLMDESTGKFKTVLVDDLLDHLDDKAIFKLFKSVQSSGIQFITAGVRIIDKDYAREVK